MDAQNVCPQCFSKKVEFKSKAQLMINSASTAAGFFIGGLFYPPLKIVMWICLIVAALAPFGHSIRQCNDCHFWWKTKEW